VLNFNPLLRLPEFAAGILACRIWSTDSRLVNRTSFEWLIPLLVAALLAWRTPLNPDLATLGLFCPAIAVWLVVLAASRGALSRFHALPLCVRLGHWSYALYILHLPVWGLMLAANQENGELMNPRQVPFLIVTFVATAGLAAAAHQFVEVPYRRAFLQAWRPLETHG